MKKIKVLLCISLLVFSFSLCEGQSWLWGRQGTVFGMKATTSIAITTDITGSAYITGSFYPFIAFGKDTLVDSTLTTQWSNCYFAKYNSAGIAQWATQFTSSSGECEGNAIAADNKNHVFITGNFYDDITVGINNFSSFGIGIFLAKSDSAGNIIWAVSGIDSLGGSLNSNGVAVDTSGNVFITGWFAGALKLGSYTLTPPSDTNIAIFIAKYDKNGNLLWADQATDIHSSTSAYNESFSVATDMQGDAFITGYYSDTVAFGSQILTSPRGRNTSGGNVFLAKYNAAGNVLWAKQSTIPTHNDVAAGYSVTTDNAGSAYITGKFTDTIAFGSSLLKGTGLFLVKYDKNGTMRWAENTTGYFGNSLSSDQLGNIYLAGGGDTGKISMGAFILSSVPGLGNSFIIKLDTSGNGICGSFLPNGEVYPEVLTSSASDITGKYVYIANDIFYDTIFCNLDTLFSSHGDEEPFIARWQNCNQVDEAINQLKTKSEELRVFPNPFCNATTISIDNGQLTMNNYLELYDLTGQKLKQLEFKGNEYNLSADGLAKGMYFVRVSDINNNVIGTTKIIVQ